uniref:Isoform A5 of Protein cortex n=1 Tax=Biston betularia TaxID=82595 RepID=P0DOC0-5
MGVGSSLRMQSSKYLQQKRYINFLDEAFGLAPLKAQQRNSDTFDDWCWPCAPRKKSYLSTADNVLDLPSYSITSFPDVLDWSHDDILVAALGKKYHKWSWRTQSPVDQGQTMFDIRCCKFDPKGKRLLLGTDMRVEVHNELSKCQFVQYCKCNIQICTITAIDWSPTGNSFVTGCSRGRICAMNEKDFPIKSLVLIEGAMLVVKISPNARYVAVAGVHKHRVWILSWPDLIRFRFMKTNEIVKDLNWHPWQTALLGVATLSSDRHASMIIWEPHATDKLRQQDVGRGRYSIDAMRFNNKTGELLLSLWSLDVNVPYPKSSELVVMSNFDTVVDHWGESHTGLNRIRTMVFSPDGTKLATATADEDLIIWNFLPNDYKKILARKKFTAFPQFLDICSYGYTIR